MAVRALADAFIRIRPDATGFRAEVDAKLTAQMAGASQSVTIMANTAVALTKMAGLREQMDELNRKVVSARLIGDDKQLQLMLAKLQVQLQALEKKTTAKKVTLEGADKVETQLMALNIAADKWIAEALDKRVNLDTADARTRLAYLITAGSDLSRKAYAARVGLTGDAAVKMAALVHEIENLTDKAWNIRLGVDDAEIQTAAAAMAVLTTKLNEMTFKTLPATTNATNRLWGIWRLLSGEIALFGGAAKVGVWHIALDGLLETFAILVPAVVVLAADLLAFGVAGADAAIDVYNKFKALNTVSTALNKTIPPMTGAFKQMQAAARPQVFQLMGDAISILNEKSGFFAKIAFYTGGVVDRLAAKFVVFTRSGTGGLQTFFKVGTEDLAQIGIILHNVGDAIAHLVSVAQKTHIAELLLAGIGKLSAVFDLITRMPTPLLVIGVALHSIYLWGGLAATVLLKMAIPFSNLAAAAGGIGKTQRAVAGLSKESGPMERMRAISKDLVGGLAAIPGRISGIGKTAEQAGQKVSLMARASTLLSKVPWQVWVGVAAVALGVLIFKLATARSAAQRFSDAIVMTAKNASNAQVFQVINNGMTQLIEKTNQSRAHLQDMATAAGANAEALRTNAVATARFGTSASGLGQSIASTKGDIQAYTDAQRALQQEQTNVRQNAEYLAKTYHTSIPGAIGLATTAGVKLTGQFRGNSEAAKTNRQQVQALVQAYAAMGQTGSTLGNDMEILRHQADQQYKAVKQLNAGWDTFTSDMTGTQTSFDTFALGVQTLGQNFKSAIAKTHDTTHSFQGLKEASSLAGATMDGLSQSSLTVNQAFATSVQNANAVADSWRTAGIAGNEFRGGISALISPMVKFARGSDEATAQLVGLAQQAGYKGPAAMSALVKWLGNTSGAMQRVKNVTNDATEQTALLTTSMRGQGSFIANKLVGDINAGILAYEGVEKAARAYGNAIAEDGKQSDAAIGARNRLITSLIETGKAAHESDSKIAAMISRVLGIPKSAAMQLIMNGVGKFKIESGLQNVTNNPPLTKAMGGVVPGGGSADSVHALLTPGEVVIPKGMVMAGAVDHLKGKLPGFAAGGQVGANPSLRGNVDVLSGQYAVTQYDLFTKKFTAAMASTMRSALKAAEAAAAAANAFGAPGPGGGAPAANAALARRLMPSWGSGSEWAAWNYLEMREAGWNQFARNPSSGAYGIPQALPPGKMGAAANPPQSNPTAQIRWMIGYIQGRYGDPIAAANHERAFNWYSSGTDGAAKGWAMVGERGPELVNFHGGETVLPHHMSKSMGGLVAHYAKGTKGHKHHKAPLNDRLENALHYIHSNQNEPARYTRIEKHLEAVRTYMNNERTLVKFGRLKGAALRDAKRGLHHDENEYKAVLKEIRPYTKTRGWIRGLQDSIHTQENHLNKAIAVATNQGHRALAGRLKGQVKWYTKTNKELGTWLDRLLPVGGNSPSGRAVRRLNRKNAALIEDAIGDAIRAAGLPVVPYGSYDKGGWLPRGLSLAYNGTGRPEKVGAQPQQIILQVSNSNAMFDKFMTQWFQHAVQVKGGGDVQVAFGRVN